MSTITRKLSSRIVPVFRKISTMSLFQVMEPSLDPKVFNVNEVAVGLNLVLLYGFAAVTVIVPTLLGVSQRGFFCDDDSIRYEYRKDTITAVQLMLYNLVLNAATVLFVEYYRMQKVESNINNPRYRWRNNHLHVLFVRLLTYFGYSQIGFVMNIALNIVTKHVVGRLRPHFLDVCKLANDTCVTGDSHRYITDYTCTGPPELVLEARKSFYSGHSAVSLYCATWSALYIQARLGPVLNNRIVVPISQTLMFMIGLGISFSRITDNKHHWSDVLVGIFIGIFLAVYTCTFWTDLFSNNSTESETQPLLLPRPPRTPRNSEDEERHRLDAVLPSTDSSIVFEATGPQDSDTILLPVPQSA
ncbi:Phosphatidic acid phosphatase type 2/haloperoxidase domain-containing protein [Caenorhabditis elegans]|uniref:Phosphatidic acid phosphatase type 2/haloperoxidase domain-containing protein n=1 Tax=Caenorhabditis elegans TaxID=6239 RepID=A8WFI4_CAEEL|nr:Phosphatidic acid phosphatase type 2/haloperoxidase domain-containing protein [Caenorhabditis elegans]CCD72709.1 Phosphatidic acid phosphatase type 2/haloperoxidase domain-containing protein [Caenorhabditis elegans]|eukprot:NP_001122646.1 Phospholipid phosphatase homolog 1.2 homolog [Caenorhabditis elegans]